MLFQQRAQNELGQTFPPGAVIFRQGEPADCCYVLLEGRVEMSAEENDTCWLSLEIVEKDEVFGATSLFGNTTRILTARALEETRVLSLDQSKFLQWVQNDPALALRILLSMANRSHRLIDRVMYLQKQLNAASA
ncbi:MAG: cyclic nucleotide-binding domain-containing protein [Magnetococcus sp. YQC-3]